MTRARIRESSPTFQSKETFPFSALPNHHRSTKLFAFYVGGSTTTSNVELHDMRFAVGEKMEDCFPSLRNQWWGTPESLHIDAWTEVTHADGYSISLQAEPFFGKGRLYFANLGGYDMKQFTELHNNVFVVAADKASATKRGLATVSQWELTHRDTLFEVENIISLDEVPAEHGLHIHLAAVPSTPPLPFVTGLYILLQGKN